MTIADDAVRLHHAVAASPSIIIPGIVIAAKGCFSRHRYTLDRNVMLEVASLHKRASSCFRVMVIVVHSVPNLDSINGEAIALLKTNGQMGLVICRNI